MIPNLTVKWNKSITEMLQSIFHESSIFQDRRLNKMYWNEQALYRFEIFDERDLFLRPDSKRDSLTSNE